MTLLRVKRVQITSDIATQSSGVYGDFSSCNLLLEADVENHGQMAIRIQSVSVTYLITVSASVSIKFADISRKYPRLESAHLHLSSIDSTIGPHMVSIYRGDIPSVHLRAIFRFPTQFGTGLYGLEPGEAIGGRV